MSTYKIRKRKKLTSRGTRSVVRKAFEVCRPRTMGRAILEYVNGEEAVGDQRITPFDGSRKPISIKNYKVAVRYIVGTLSGRLAS